MSDESDDMSCQLSTSRDAQVVRAPAAKFKAGGSAWDQSQIHGSLGQAGFFSDILT